MGKGSRVGGKRLRVLNRRRSWGGRGEGRGGEEIGRTS